MPQYLTFSIVAPLAAFGGLAVGELRPSWERPAKSAILGLVAGALGKERDDTEAHVALDRELLYAVRTEDMRVQSSRRLITDYHTIQAPPRGRARHFATRREEVADKQKLTTILSYREYRSDCSFSIALWSRSSSLRFSLEQIAAALRKPRFIPYVGRKSCPSMLPMYPLLIETHTVEEAFIERDRQCERQKAFLKSCGLIALPNRLAMDADAPEVAGDRTERRRDQVIARTRWQFGLRDEVVRLWKGDRA